MAVEAGKDIVGGRGLTIRRLNGSGAGVKIRVVSVLVPGAPVDLDEVSPQGRAVYGVGRIMAVGAKGDIIRHVRAWA